MSEATFDLILDPQFQRLIPPLAKDEYRLLEESILREGCRDPIITWQGIILDGYNRYDICKKANCPYRTVELEMSSREEAMSWICANQLGRRNLSEEMRRYLIGKRYEIEKQILRKENKPIWEPLPEVEGSTLHEAATHDSEGHLSHFRALMKNPTAERIGEEYHISHGTVEKYGRYSRALDTISGVSPELTPQILSGSFKVSQENIVALSKLDGPNMHRYARQLQNSPSDPFLRYRDTRKRLSGMLNPALESKVIVRSSSPPPAIHTNIKQMPVYNPDAEVTGLTLTIPTWGSSIHRVLDHSNLLSVTPAAREKLTVVLTELQKDIIDLLNAIQEVE